MLLVWSRGNLKVIRFQPAPLLLKLWVVIDLMPLEINFSEVILLHAAAAITS